MYQLSATIADRTLLRGEVALLRHGFGMVLGPMTAVDGPFAHVEADFFGGDGYQTAQVWRDGELAWGPVHDDRFDGPREAWPINAALAELGVPFTGRGLDLFAEVGLGLGRDLDDWHRHIRAGRVPEFPVAPAPMFPLPLTGTDVMRLLGIPRGPRVGAALAHLRGLGELTRDEAEAALRAWRP